MRIGILSDTHGRVPNAAAALKVLAHADVEHYLHCGDVGDEGVLDLLAGLPIAVVWGNNDYDRAHLADYARRLGILIYDDLADITLAGKRIAVTHGDNSALLHQLLNAQQHDYIFQGHTHVAADERFGRTRLINPGALHRTARPSVAVLDTQTDVLRVLSVAIAGRR